MAVLDALAAKLVAAGQGTLATNIFLSRMPDTPDVCVTLVESLGPDGGQTFGAGISAYSVVRVRALCRAAKNDYPAARAKASAVRGVLGAIRTETISGDSILCVMATGDVYPVGRDGDDRPVIGADFTVWIP